jgi:hypothetical protein
MDAEIKKVFLSHSSQDAEYVKMLSETIEALDSTVKVFASTRPSAIPSGKDWLETVLNELEEASVLVMLITRPAENSVWVGFELGYFWKRMEKTKIHALLHPQATVPSPLDALQAKKINNLAEITEFFRALCEDLQIDWNGQIHLDILLEYGNSISSKPTERSLANFERLLEISTWDKITLASEVHWICADDALFQIVIDYADAIREDFHEAWTDRFDFPDKHHTYYSVLLTISGLPIREVYFVSLDGGRYFVPVPELISNKQDQVTGFKWKRNSLIFKVAKIISNFYPVLPSFEVFAQRTGIEIVG